MNVASGTYQVYVDSDAYSICAMILLNSPAQCHEHDGLNHCNYCESQRRPPQLMPLQPAAHAPNSSPERRRNEH